MKLTKYDHACIVLEEQGQKLIIDPGAWTPAFGDLTNVVAVVITHVHSDHFHPAHVSAIVAANPDAQIFTTEEVNGELANATIAKDGQKVSAGLFNLEFGGDFHSEVHPSVPRPHNASVMVNDVFYYPGDSYTKPSKPVKVLAVPANAPWMKVADSMSFIAEVKPAQCIPTHNGLLSENGNETYNFWLEKASKDSGATFTYLKSGESIEVS